MALLTVPSLEEIDAQVAECCEAAPKFRRISEIKRQVPSRLAAQEMEGALPSTPGKRPRESSFQDLNALACSKGFRSSINLAAQVEAPRNGSPMPVDTVSFESQPVPEPLSEECVDTPSRPAPEIRAISESVVHTICSSQVIVSLASAAKELIENSLDAGAHTIEIRVRDYGTGVLEVVDDGSGVSESDFEALVLKSHTSKIRKFEDLELGVATLGFRGEALSSLCGVSDIVVTTRATGTEDTTLGWRLVYDHQHQLVQRTRVARPVGTTVSVSHLFEPLPVRRREFLRTSRREYAQLVRLVQQYTVLRPDCRWTLHHIVKDKPQVVLTTPANATLETAVAASFGARLVRALTEVDWQDGNGIRIHGLVAAPASCSTGGAGLRGSNDAQFLFVNGRPVDLPKLSRKIADIYRQFSAQGAHMSPVWFLKIEISSQQVDVNVTPDKRKVFLHAEERILTFVEQKFHELWDPTSRSIPTAEPAVLVTPPRPRRSEAVVTETPEPCSSSKQIELDADDECLCSSCPTLIPKKHTFEAEQSSPAKTALAHPVLSLGRSATIARRSSVASFLAPPPLSPVSPRTPGKGNAAAVSPSASPKGDSEGEATEMELDQSPKLRTAVEENPIQTSIPGDLLAALRGVISKATRKPTEAPRSGSYRAGINMQDAQACERELCRTVRKDDFQAMRVAGQFNEGFVIARHTGTQDLYIIDQHAADEKAKYEQLFSSTSLTCQPLVVPKPCELTPADEEVVRENMSVFQANGFNFITAEGSGRLHLATLPLSRRLVFDIADVHELVGLLRDRPGVMCRPSKVHAMLASRACRSAVMIGTSLDHRQMTEIVHHLGTMHQPWNCPHGRPTMRHIATLPFPRQQKPKAPNLGKLKEARPFRPAQILQSPGRSL
eukprot:TRINITY_DN12776_c0_g1_i1.p1 TRINITY_DN12776_c0_g1~~TRINITY_DN12776_c0_g1_i1.p1  ORF type:complete len:902 (+),score=110.33 TRINITY_DN12776_c0_g1_i1:24-2708(+)